MIEQFELACGVMKSRYMKILSKYYPAHGRTGFTERNLTNNLVAALEQVLGNNCISWFEAPICLDNGKHMDAVVFLDDVTIFIEAKRLTSIKPQLESITEDVERMFSAKTIELVEKGLLPVNSDRRRYSIVLADVWTENEEKIAAHKVWPSQLPSGFKESIVFSHRLSFDELCVDGNWKNNYKILIVISEIKR